MKTFLGFFDETNPLCVISLCVFIVILTSTTIWAYHCCSTGKFEGLDGLATLHGVMGGMKVGQKVFGEKPITQKTNEKNTPTA